MSTSNRITPIEWEELPAQKNVDLENNSIEMQKESDSTDAWLPITESREGNAWSCIFHLVSSRLGTQALFLPVAFATLGWVWGLIYLSLGFVWQLYTGWLLVHLHESSSGVRYSRFLQLASTAFGPKLAKWLCTFPVLYLSGGTCTILVVTGGSTLKLLYDVICSQLSHCPKNLDTSIWFLIFVLIASLLSQHPSLNSLRWVSFLGSIVSLSIFAILWITSIAKGTIKDASYNPTYEDLGDKLTSFISTIFAMELIALSFRGHNLILEIQGTLPSNSKHPSHITMWKALQFSYLLVALCIFPLAIAGYWAYGDKMTRTGMLYALREFHKDKGSTTILGLILVLLSVHQLCSYPVYAMPTYDNFELRYVMAKKKQCPVWMRRTFRLFYCFAVNFFLAMALPFLPSLAPITGAIAMVLTFSYPCIMYVCIKKPKVWEPMFLLNWGLGCLGVVLSVIYFIVSIWVLSREGLTANFFNPN